MEELRENYEKEKVKLDSMKPEKPPQTIDGVYILMIYCFHHYLLNTINKPVSDVVPKESLIW